VKKCPSCPGSGSRGGKARRIPTSGSEPEARHVAVYQTNDRTSAHLGELSVTSLASRGCARAVIDGGARDIDYILREEFPSSLVT
jgi:regulator of RNase E activity RraA